MMDIEQIGDGMITTLGLILNTLGAFVIQVSLLPVGAVNPGALGRWTQFRRACDSAVARWKVDQ